MNLDGLLADDPARDDKLILVDGLDREVGTATKLEAHVEGVPAPCVLRRARTRGRGRPRAADRQAIAAQVLTVDVAAALLGSIDSSQLYGNVLDEDLSEVLQSLLQKFVKGDALRLYPNEIKGVDAFDWEAFPQALVVSGGGIQLAEFRSEEVALS